MKGISGSGSVSDFGVPSPPLLVSGENMPWCHSNVDSAFYVRVTRRVGCLRDLPFSCPKSKAVESLAEGGGSEIQRVKEDAQKKDVKAAQAELEKAFAGTETEKALRLSLENKLSEMMKMHKGDLEAALVLEEKDRLIEELKLSLKSKEALIQCLQEAKSQMASPDKHVSSGEPQGLSGALRGEEERETEAAQMERQKERNRFEERIQALQEDLREKEREIATEKKNSLKRDKAIQGLTMALKSKEKEVEELNSEIEKLNTAFAKAREALQKTQTQNFQNSEKQGVAQNKETKTDASGSEDYEAALLEKAALLAELHSENLTKSTENHRLRRNVKKVTQELSDLQQEKERLEKDLEAAHREKSKGDCTIHNLAVSISYECFTPDLGALACPEFRETRWEVVLPYGTRMNAEKHCQRTTKSVGNTAALFVDEPQLKAIAGVPYQAVLVFVAFCEFSLMSALREPWYAKAVLSSLLVQSAPVTLKGKLPLRVEIEATQVVSSYRACCGSAHLKARWWAGVREGFSNFFRCPFVQKQMGFDLRNEVEKLRNEVKEGEKAVENRYKSLLSESNQKLHSQEQVIRRLTESASQKDSLLQKFDEKDLEAIQQNRYLMTTEDLKFRNENLITEKCSSQQSPGSKIIFSEEKQQLDYEELIQVLKKERDIYTHLVKSLQDSDSINNLQAELNSVSALRKQLERDVLSYRNLQKTLEEQISEIRRREEEPFSFYSDQTSYLSICLEEPNRFQVDHFSQEELKKKVSDLLQLVKELYADNQHLKKTIFDLSSVGFQGGDGLESVQQTELLASKEDEDMTKTGEDDESNFLSEQDLEQSNKIMEDYSKGGCKNGYLRHMDSNILDYDGAHKPGCPGDQSVEEGKLMNLLAPFFNEKATLLLESRPDLLKVLRELLLEHISLTEQEVSGEHLDGKTEKTLKQMAVQLRGELRHFIQTNSFSKPHDDLKSLWGAQLGEAGEVSKVELKDASVQTRAMEGDMLRFKHEGKRQPWEEKPSDAIFSAEHQPENLCTVPGQQAPPLSFPSGTHKDAKKSRLPILIKSCRSLGSLHQLPATQAVVAQLQGQILELQGELKEFKIRNKQLHQKLILAEAMMEGRPTPDKAPVKAQPLVEAAYQDSPGEQEGIETMPCVCRDKERDNDQHTSYKTDSEIYQPDDLAILPTCKENPSEDFPGPASGATHLGSKCQLSTKGSVIGTDQSENIDTSNDTENLKQRICDLETELEGYRNFILQLQKHSQCSEAVITVLCGTEGAQDGLHKLKGSTDEEEMTFSSLHQVRYVKHMQILHSLPPERIDGRMLESLKQQLVEQEYELQKEQNLNMELFSEIHNLQNKFRDLSPSRYDSLVQSQARELSLQRQQITDGRGICVIAHQHMNTVIKAFQELLQASDVDYYVAEGFQEQLNQCAELLEKLEKLFLNGLLGGPRGNRLLGFTYLMPLCSDEMTAEPHWLLLPSSDCFHVVGGLHCSKPGVQGSSEDTSEARPNSLFPVRNSAFTEESQLLKVATDLVEPRFDLSSSVCKHTKWVVHEGPHMFSIELYPRGIFLLSLFFLQALSLGPRKDEPETFISFKTFHSLPFPTHYPLDNNDDDDEGETHKLLEVGALHLGRGQTCSAQSGFDDRAIVSLVWMDLIPGCPLIKRPLTLSVHIV
ncbi:hypothetical protein HPG69_013484 [Diceros bicornis minor]|uniref:CDK5 regulatory subunit-associated protein 2/Myomegalin coiled coil domain-containing protein n=1 Tax=Diceros bicornis minor TaxID=77932 RepID=A0A7J7EPK0_DICBM|nr:hypothetical protein HPG69_013484 [Diceros bicornis minor]